MPGKGPAFPISKEWKLAVREAIDAKIRNPHDSVKSDAAFARLAKIKKNTLHDALQPAAMQTPQMPAINAALGWPTPRVLSTPDELEIWAMVEALPDFELGKFLGRAEEAIARIRSKGRT